MTSADVRRMRADATHCPLCGCELANGRYQSNSKHLDHIIPISMGGTHTRGNLRIVCQSCNLARGKEPADLDGFQQTLWSVVL